MTTTTTSATTYKVFLTIGEDVRILPFWLDFHKHIFCAGVVLGVNGREDVKQMILRFFPEWELTDSYADTLSSDDTIIFVPMSITEFLIAESASEIVDKNQLQKITAYIDMKRSAPNNIVEFFSNIYETTAIATEPTESIDEIELTFAKNTLSESESVAVDVQGLPTGEVTGETKYEFRRLNLLSPSPLNISIQELVFKIKTRLTTTDYVYYLDVYIHSDVNWGEDRVILAGDTNLLERTKFNAEGHAIFPMKSHNTFLKQMVGSKIEELTSRHIDIEKYHQYINDEEHTRIINAMPWKKTESPEIQAFAEYMEARVSEILERRVKIFNDDIWVRICRPSSVTDTDYNPCHRDIYLDFYRNIANIYVPIVGSNERSSLAMQTGSHLWNERDIVVTRGGAFFLKTGKKYSVDAVLRSRQPLNMLRPNPAEDEFILFSPYLIHGCSSNENEAVTRMSVEIRFIEDTEGGRIQEAEFRAFLEKRVWR